MLELMWVVVGVLALLVFLGASLVVVLYRVATLEEVLPTDEGYQ